VIVIVAIVADNVEPGLMSYYWKLALLDDSEECPLKHETTLTSATIHQNYPTRIMPKDSDVSRGICSTVKTDNVP
jgi:hypothetical protein